MRILAAALVVALALPVCAQDLSQKVTFEAAGLPAKRALQMLGEQTKVQLLTAPQTASEVLVIRVKDVPLSTLMAKIAQATSGAWKQEGTLYRLEADNAARQAEARAEAQARTKEIQKAIDRLLKPQTEGGPVGGAAGGGGNISVQVGFGGGGNDPASKAILKFLPSIGAASLAAIPREGRVVYSTNPTRMQLPLPGNSRSIVQQLVAEHNVAAEKRQQAEAGRERTKQQEEMEQFARMLGFAQTDKPIEGAPDKILLVASRQTLFDGVMLQLRLYDTRGAMVLSGTQMIAIDQGIFGDFATLVAGGQQTPQPQEPDKDVVFSDRSKRLQEFFKTAVNPAAVSRQPLPKDVKDIFLHPDQDDPLSLIQGEAALFCAQDKGLNMVANLPDTMINAFGTFFAPTNYKVNAYLKELQTGRNTVGKIEDGWLVVKPSRPSDARTSRVDRLALAALLAAADKKGQPSLDDLAAYSLKAEAPMSTPAAMVYLGVLAPNASGQSMQGVVNWNLLRLYATLSPTQRSSMAQGAPIRFSTLGPAQRDYVHRILFGASTRLQVEAQAQQRQEEENSFISMIRSFMPASSKDFRDEPTEVMPMGLPAEGTIRLRVEGGRFAMIAGGQGAGPSSMYGALGADELAMMRYFKEDQQFSAFSGFMPALDKLKLGERQTLTFKFYAAQNVAQTEVLRDDKMSQDATTVAYDDLPANFKRRVDERLAAMKRNPIPFGAMMGGFRPPP